MWNLTKHFAFGSLLGGVVVGLISAYIVHNADAALWQIWAGYIVFGCISGLIYGLGLALLRLTRIRAEDSDPRTALIAGAICPVAEYAVTTIANRPDFARTLLVITPLCAALAAHFRKSVCAKRAGREACPNVSSTDSVDSYLRNPR